MTSLPGSSEEQKTSSVLRDLLFAGVAVIAFALIAVRLWALQIAQGEEHARKSRENFVQTKRVEHDRGELVDRDGRVLVANRPSVNIYITPAFLPRASRLVERLGSEAGLSRNEAQAVTAAFKRSAAEQGPPILLARELTEPQVRGIRRQQADLELPLEAVPIIEAPAEHGDLEYAAYLDPAHFPSDSRVLQRLARIMEMSETERTKLEKRLERATGLDRYVDILVRPDVTTDLIESLRHEIDLDELPGVSVRAAKTRDYRFGSLAAHLIGYINELSPRELELKRDLGYRIGDLIGRRGIEQAFEDELRGVDGAETVVVDSKGREQRSHLAAELREEIGAFEPPRAGNRVVLTIDTDVQRVAEQAFPGPTGAVVALEVQTGRILAITSTPAFNPNLVSGYFEPGERARLISISQYRPWRFRAIQDHYAPGSTFKAVTALAGLSRGAIDAGTHVHCGGAFRLGNIRFRCWKDSGHGSVEILMSLARSCDVYYYTLGNRIGLDAIAATAGELGFGRPTGIGVFGESAGILPTVAWYNQRLEEGYTQGAAVNASIGQGAVNVTPLQLAVAYAAIANGGTVYEPQVALRVEAHDGSAVREFKPNVVRKLNLPKPVFEMVQEGLRRVVNDPNGTAYSKRLKSLQVSGKTGTAQVAKLGEKRLKDHEVPYELRDHAWFAAFAPAAAPEISVVVLNEHGGHGGSAAAPTAMAVIQAWWDKKVAREKLGAVPRAPLEIAALGDEEL